eukprot:TRINITY_DN2900_c0_g2_i1.p1 TRINITY_DN2900_c0_g2~~TRINITY_DN2900_c0_g2_i1.p1  ORF type:complete len:481 (+),score=97.52 TRINITY_DN2900_c0_g2_i1:142-1584(+)
MPKTMLDTAGFAAALGSMRQLDVRTKCIVLAGSICAVLPLEIHHLLAVLVGALGYMLLQTLESSARLAPKGKAFMTIKAEPPVAPWRSKKAQAAKDTGKPNCSRAQPQASAAAASSPLKPDVKKPSAVPVQALTFKATGWEAEVQELLQQIMPTTESKASVDAIAMMVRNSLVPVLPDIEVDGFAHSNPMGGTAFGVAVPEVDIVVTLNPMSCKGLQPRLDASKLQKSLIRTCTDRLVSNGAFKFRRSAFRSSEPKVTMIAPAVIHGQAGIPISLWVNACTPAHATVLYEACGKLDSRAQSLILLVRRWAKDRGVSHAAKGHLGPYSWTLLAVYYLQVGMQDGTSILPELSGLVKSGQMPSRVEHVGSMSAAELFKGFLEFYSQHFNWRNEAVSVRLGKRSPPHVSLPVHVLLHEDGKTTQVGISIENPFDVKDNMGDCLNWLTMDRLREELIRGQNLSSSGASLAKLLEPWSPPDQPDN